MNRKLFLKKYKSISILSLVIATAKPNSEMRLGRTFDWGQICEFVNKWKDFFDFLFY